MSLGRVLVVDDHEDIRMVLAALMRASGRYQVVAEAADGAEAIAVAEGLEVDAVILDLSMPVMDGLQALPRLRELVPKAKVIVLSGFGTDRTVYAAMNAGADAFLAKGADLPSALVPLLDRLLPWASEPSSVRPEEDPLGNGDDLIIQLGEQGRISGARDGSSRA